uniref:Uncharacterized protein n=1 Tax=Acrobeloides nanus TaxID=290746 RepID=A0A914EI64_9BILA
MNNALATIPIEKEHTGEEIAKLIEQCLKTKGLKMDRLTAMVRVDAKNMQKSCRLLEIERTQVFGTHKTQWVLNPCVQNLMCSEHMGSEHLGSESNGFRIHWIRNPGVGFGIHWILFRTHLGYFGVWL